MKRSISAIIIALGLVAPNLATASDSAGHANSIYERDLTAWNGTTQNVKIARFENEAIYKRDLATWNGAGQYVIPAHFQYDSIYENDLAAANGAGKQARVASFAYDAIYKHDLTSANGTTQNIKTTRLHHGIQDALLWNPEAVTAFACK